jgi:hypothetical protein
MLPLRRHRLDLEVVNSPAPPFQQAQITSECASDGGLGESCRPPTLLSGSGGAYVTQLGRLRSQASK